MNSFQREKSSVDTLFTILLFGIFVLFLLFLLLFSARMYRTAVDSQEENRNLYTAMTYVTTKFRQHDSFTQIYTGELEGLPALCFEDEVDGEIYDTWIYLQDGTLKELFALETSDATPDMGTPLASLTEFSVGQYQDYFEIQMTDTAGNSSRCILHTGAPVAE